jgi:hypothetical protein
MFTSLQNGLNILFPECQCYRPRTLGSNLSHIGVRRSLLRWPAGGLDLNVAAAPSGTVAIEAGCCPVILRLEATKHTMPPLLRPLKILRLQDKFLLCQPLNCPLCTNYKRHPLHGTIVLMHTCKRHNVSYLNFK